MIRWAVVAAAAFTAFGIVFGGTVPEAASSLLCVERSAAHAASHGTTVAGDSRWHVLRGELPTCGVDKASGDSVEFKPQDKKSNRDKKSRFCRKRWWC